MMYYKIPFNKPFVAGKELYYVAQAVFSGHMAGDGMFTQKCQELLKEKFQAKKVLLTNSCTAALEMAAILSRLELGDEVILPSFTFVSTANAFYSRGAKPVFVDIRPDTLNMDETKVERAISRRTRVIVPVHYAGVACQMNVIMELAHRHNLYVIEDAAQGVNAKYGDKFLGTIGTFGTYSFHETKNFGCGEGGAIVINDAEFIERAEIIREKGTDRTKFFRGEVDKYTWVDIGSSYLPSDLLAAFLYAQLENLDEISTRRDSLFRYYYNALAPLVAEGKIRTPYIPNECQGNSHLFYIIVANENIRNSLMDYLKANGILAVFHYVPLHLSPIGRSMGYSEGQLPITESLSKRLLRLPLYLELSHEEQDQVVDAIKKFFSAQ